MGENTPTIERLLELPRSERSDALEGIVTAEFKATLLMTEDEELPIDESFFDAGFTSLLIVDVKTRLESLLGCGISANVLFNSPTIERLVQYLKDEVLVDLFTPAPMVSSALPGPAARDTQASADRL